VVTKAEHDNAVIEHKGLLAELILRNISRAVVNIMDFNKTTSTASATCLFGSEQPYKRVVLIL